MIKQLIRSAPFTKDGKILERPYKVMQELIQMDILEGDGSPEGVIMASSRRLYMDTAGTSGNILYIKKVNDISGDRTMGWILV